jgi:phosphoribosylanthranilate isomerase
MKVKICGITNLEDALAAVDAGADALGFNFAEEAKAKNRYISPNEAWRIAESLPPFITTVAVTVNADAKVVMREYLAFMDRVQLHGEEPPEYAKAFASRAIKALRMGPDFSPDEINRYNVRSILLDAYDPAARGGTGKTADWELARTVVMKSRVPVLLAGGLTPENVAEAVRIVRPYGVDVSGGVEKEPGKKDHGKIRRFIHEAKLPIS